MKILFIARHFTYFRNYDSVLRELAGKGHRLHLAVEKNEAFGGQQMIEGLAAAYPNVTYGEAPGRPPDDDWAWTATQLRLGLDYLRYQHPLFDHATKLRARARERTPGVFSRLADRVPGMRWLRHPLASLVVRVERAVPEEPSIRAYLEAERPDVVLITPLVDLGSSQVDYLRAAHALRIPSAVCVWSWDHLSSKALIRECPDRVLVWNDTQKREAETLHGVPSSRIAVTGAQCYDQWFDRQPSRSRAAFCAELGLPADQPIVLYVCSALFSGSPVEAAFAVRWVRQLRADGSPALRRAGIVIRPHPSRRGEWDQMDLSGLGPVAVWGSNPVDLQSKADYFDSLYHSAAVVGLNTSAFIEAAIVGRPVHTIMLPEFEENQTGTLHFSYLLHEGGGPLRVAKDFSEHWQQLDEAISNPPRDLAPFVRAFVRPFGLDVAATPVFIRHVEALAGVTVEAPKRDVLLPLFHRLADRIRRMRRDEQVEEWVHSPREVESIRRTRERIRLQREIDAEKRSRRDLRRQARERRLAAKQAQRAQQEAQLEAARQEKVRRLAEKQADRQARLAAKRARVDEERQSERAETRTR